MGCRLLSNADYKCRKCTDEVIPLEEQPAEYVVVSKKFYNLGDMICAGGCVEESIAARIRSACT